MELVEVFKTNVLESEEADELIRKLLTNFPHYKVNFDLQDCDHILRVEGEDISSEKIIEIVTINGFHCKALE